MPTKIQDMTGKKLIVNSVLFGAPVVLAFMLAGGCASAPPPVTPAAAAFVLVGDTNGAPLMDNQGAEEDALAGVTGLLDADETLVLNLESVLQAADAPLSRCRTFPHQSVFRAPYTFADTLLPTGATIVTMANNHVLDCGGDGVLETIGELAARGIPTVGAGATLSDACRPLEISIGNLEVGIVAYLVMGPNRYSAGPRSAGAASWERCSPLETLSGLAARTDLVIASLHFHLDRGWTWEAPEENVRIVGEALAAGADVVVGHGPHVPQGIVTRVGGIGLLSLGNFVFGTGYEMPPEARESVVAKLRVHDDSLDLELVPLVLDARGRPLIPSPEVAREILSRMEDLSLSLGTRIEVEGDRASIRVER